MPQERIAKGNHKPNEIPDHSNCKKGQKLCSGSISEAVKNKITNSRARGGLVEEK